MSVPNGTPRRRPGNARRLAILRYLVDHQEAHGEVPTYRELAMGVGLAPTSFGALTRHLEILEDDGFLEKDPGRNRAITVLAAGMRRARPQVVPTALRCARCGGLTREASGPWACSCGAVSRGRVDDESAAVEAQGLADQYRGGKVEP